MAQSSKLMDTLLSRGSVRALGEIAGANDAQVQDALNVALPILVDNMRKNATSFSGEIALSTAFSDHAKDDITDVAAFLKGSDEEEGGKVLTHALGGEKYAVESDIAKKTGLTYDQSGKILAAMAPLVLSILGNIQKEKREEGRNSGIKDVLDSAMGGNGNGNAARESSFGDRLRGGLGTLFGVMKRASSAETPEKKIPDPTAVIEVPSPVKKTPGKATAAKVPVAAKRQVATKKAAVKKTAKKAAAKKPVAKKAAARKPVAKKATIKTNVAKKATAKKQAKKAITKKTGKTSAAKKVAAKKSAAKKVIAKKPGKKIVVKKLVKKAAGKKPTLKKAAAKKPAKKFSAKKATKQAAPKKVAVRKSVAKKLVKKAAVKKSIKKFASKTKKTAIQKPIQKAAKKPTKKAKGKK